MLSREVAADPTPNCRSKDTITALAHIPLGIRAGASAHAQAPGVIAPALGTPRSSPRPAAEIAAQPTPCSLQPIHSGLLFVIS